MDAAANAAAISAATSVPASSFLMEYTGLSTSMFSGLPQYVSSIYESPTCATRVVLGWLCRKIIIFEKVSVIFFYNANSEICQFFLEFR